MATLSRPAVKANSAVETKREPSGYYKTFVESGRFPVRCTTNAGQGTPLVTIPPFLGLANEVRTSCLIAGVSLLFVPTAVFAHHGLEAQFDTKKTITLVGVESFRSHSTPGVVATGVQVPRSLGTPPPLCVPLKLCAKRRSVLGPRIHPETGWQMARSNCFPTMLLQCCRRAQCLGCCSDFQPAPSVIGPSAPLLSSLFKYQLIGGRHIRHDAVMRR
jgi:hypothetical protein